MLALIIKLSDISLNLNILCIEMHYYVTPINFVRIENDAYEEKKNMQTRAI